MIKNYFRSIILLSIPLFFMNFSVDKTTYLIKGKVIGRKSDKIIILKATDDLMTTHTIIPIKDSTFEYTLTVNQPEAFLLIFKDELDNGGWKPIVIFPEEGTINCRLYPVQEFEKNQITGSKLNREFDDFQKNIKNLFYSKYQPLRDSMLALRKRNEYYNQYYNVEWAKLGSELKNARDSETRMKIRSKMADLNSGNNLSKRAQLIEEQRLVLNREIAQWRYTFINKKPSLLTYYFIMEDLKSFDYTNRFIDIEVIKKNYYTLVSKFPGHPYNEIVKNLIESRENIKVGGRYKDVTLPDLNGKFYKLSDLIHGKIALIALWSTWCGPCIETSKSMIPVYEDYKDKGFTICAIAADKRNTDQIEKIIRKEKFPWINLVDLDHRNKIWYKYGIPDAGGTTVLVDQHGKVLAIHPTADEIRKILSEKLK